MEENSATSTMEAQAPKSSAGLVGIIVVVIIVAVGAWLLMGSDSVEALPAEEVFANVDTEMGAFFSPEEPISVSFEGSMIMDAVVVDSGQEIDMLLDFDMSGAVNVDEDQELSVQAEMDFNALKADVPGFIDFDLGQPELEMRIVGDSIYILGSKLESIGFFDLSTINGQWMELENPGLQDEFQAGLDEAGLEDIESGQPSFEMFTSIEELGTEKIRGVQSYHYRVTLEEEGADDLNWEAIPVDIWIGADDFLLRKVSFTADVADLEQEPSGDMEGTMTLEFEMFDYGDAVEIDVPSDARPFEELLEESLEA